MLRFAVSKSVHAQVGSDGPLESGLVWSRAVVAAARSATDRQKPLVLEDARGLLDRHDADVEQLRHLVERADLRARLTRQNELAQFGGSRLHQLTSRDLDHFLAILDRARAGCRGRVIDQW